VGLIQREIESAGISTISVTLSREITRKVRPPRALYTGLPLGHPLGFPGQAFFHTQVLRLLLEHLERIETPGTLVEVDLGLTRKDTVECKACGSG
jgi:hypothetical protein